MTQGTLGAGTPESWLPALPVRMQEELTSPDQEGCSGQDPDLSVPPPWTPVSRAVRSDCPGVKPVGGIGTAAGAKTRGWPVHRHQRARLKAWEGEDWADLSFIFFETFGSRRAGVGRRPWRQSTATCKVGRSAPAVGGLHEREGTRGPSAQAEQSPPEGQGTPGRQGRGEACCCSGVGVPRDTPRWLPGSSVTTKPDRWKVSHRSGEDRRHRAEARAGAPDREAEASGSRPAS